MTGANLTAAEALYFERCRLLDVLEMHIDMLRFRAFCRTLNEDIARAAERRRGRLGASCADPDDETE